ncbi:predicted protein [Streptomyces viridosporus ATCC 14672]|uniref:Predicted protein n=1 Tax=Streptomyces viridosporus (strain ATCC 14672 / DSM 40746 / JCM 4963 / KCTC 9882 / NRRL B-12104 / FH 1290) TaxID=566461 RepID=D5ZY12_STRV1|nr:predicted protein [Streptomyces viridosporus ATCC 14672]
MPRHPSGSRPPNLCPAGGEPSRGCARTAGQPAVTRPELGLYTKSDRRIDRFPQVRSYWGCQDTAGTENNPLIGLPNQHIVGLTYVP